MGQDVLFFISLRCWCDSLFPNTVVVIMMVLIGIEIQKKNHSGKETMVLFGFRSSYASADC